jgi:site-specific DNA recombinase
MSIRSYHSYKPVKYDRYVLYVRKSEEDETRQVRSLKDQIKDCELLCEAEGIKIKKCDILTESKSARRPKVRPVWSSIVAEFHKPNPKWDGIIAWHPNRISRNALEAGEVIQMLDDEEIKDLKFFKYRFHNDSSGKEHLFMEFARAKGYVDALSDVVSRGMKNASEEGRWVYGKMKYGYVKDRDSFGKTQGFAVPHPVDFKLIQEAFQLRRRERTYLEIAEYMNENGATGHMTKQRLMNYLSDPFYCGLWKINRKKGGVDEVNLQEVYNFKAAVSQDDWEEVQSLNISRTQGSVPKKKWVFAGKVSCSACGGKRYPNTPGNKGIIHFTCQNRECPEKGGANLYNLIFPVIEEILRDGLGLDENEYKKYLFTYKVKIEAETLNLEHAIRSLTSKRGHAKKNLKEELEKLSALAVRKDSASKKAYDHISEGIEGIEVEIKRYTKQIAAMEDDEVCVAGSLKDFLELSRNAYRYWQKADMVQKRQIAEILFSNLEVGKSEVASVRLNEPFESLRIHPKVLNGRGYRARTCDLSLPKRAR